jgi:hypothetical protein
MLLAVCRSRPVGKMKVSIKARWMKDATVDPDAQTEVTALSEFSGTVGRSHGGGGREGGGDGQVCDDQVRHRRGRAHLPADFEVSWVTCGLALWLPCPTVPFPHQ